MRNRIRIAVVLAVVILGVARLLSGGSETTKTAPTPTTDIAAEAPKTAPAPEQPPAKRAEPKRDTKTHGPSQRVLDNVTVKNYGRVVHQGRMDLGPSIDRILKGKRHPHRNDGAVFRNRENRLPSKPRAYYREYVHPTQDVRGPGPQRLLVGSGGEWYYTPDHYETFVRLKD